MSQPSPADGDLLDPCKDYLPQDDPPRISQVTGILDYTSSYLTCIEADVAFVCTQLSSRIEEPASNLLYIYGILGLDPPADPMDTDKLAKAIHHVWANVLLLPPPILFSGWDSLEHLKHILWRIRSSLETRTLTRSLATSLLSDLKELSADMAGFRTSATANQRNQTLQSNWKQSPDRSSDSTTAQHAAKGKQVRFVSDPDVYVGHNRPWAHRPLGQPSPSSNMGDASGVDALPPSPYAPLFHEAGIKVYTPRQWGAVYNPGNGPELHPSPMGSEICNPLMTTSYNGGAYYRKHRKEDRPPPEPPDGRSTAVPFFERPPPKPPDSSSSLFSGRPPPRPPDPNSSISMFSGAHHLAIYGGQFNATTVNQSVPGPPGGERNISDQLQRIQRTLYFLIGVLFRFTGHMSRHVNTT